MNRGFLGTITLAALVLAACGSDAPEEESTPPPSVSAQDTDPADEATDDTATDETDPTDNGGGTDTATDDDADAGAGEEGSDDGEQAGAGGTDTRGALRGEIIEAEPGAAFLSPDVNIVCFFDGDDGGKVLCDPAATAEPIDLLEDAGCDMSAQRPVIVLADGKVTGDCWDGLLAPKALVSDGGAWVGDGLTRMLPAGPGAALEDSEVLQTPGAECTVVGEDTVTCQDRDGEHGFTLALNSFETW